MKFANPLKRFDAAAGIIEIVCERMNVTVAELESRRRPWRLVWPRFLAIYLIRRHTGMTTVRIGLIFKRCDSDITHACQAVEAELETSEPARALVAWFEGEILVRLKKEAA